MTIGSLWSVCFFWLPSFWLGVRWVSRPLPSPGAPRHKRSMCRLMSDSSTTASHMGQFTELSALSSDSLSWTAHLCPFC